MKRRIVAVLLCCCMAFTTMACGSDDTKTSSNNDTSETKTENISSADSEQEAEEIDPWAPYDEPITITSYSKRTMEAVLEEGVTIENNALRDWWASNGVNVEYTVIAESEEEYTSKVNLAIASGEIPDFLNVNAQQFEELYEADMIMPLNELIEEYGYDYYKWAMTTDDGLSQSVVTRDGQIYGFTQPIGAKEGAWIVAVRQDWLDELGLDRPSTIDELWDVAKAFKENNMGGTCTIGMSVDSAASGTITRFMNAYGAYYNNWVDVDGQLEASIIQPEVKEALAILSEKYEEGIIDPEFITKSGTNVCEDLLSGKSGVWVWGWGTPMSLDSGWDLGQEWAFIPLYDENGEYSTTEAQVGFPNCVVVSKECEHPEALLKMQAWYWETEVDWNTEDQYQVQNAGWPFIYDMVANQNSEMERSYFYWLETGEFDELAVNMGFDDPDSEEFPNRLKYKEEGDAAYRITHYLVDPDEGTFPIVLEVADSDKVVISEFTSSKGEVYSEYDGILTTIKDQAIINIVTGQKDVDYFDTFVEEWKSSGGDAVTAEVNEWYQNQK